MTVWTDTDDVRRLLAAVVLRAVKDAEAGDVQAADWLLHDAEPLAGGMVGIDFAELAKFARKHGATVESA